MQPQSKTSELTTQSDAENESNHSDTSSSRPPQEEDMPENDSSSSKSNSKVDGTGFVDDIKTLFDFLRNMGIIGAIIATIPLHPKWLSNIGISGLGLYISLLIIMGISISLYAHNLYWLIKSLRPNQTKGCKKLMHQINLFLVILFFSGILLAIALSEAIPSINRAYS